MLPKNALEPVVSLSMVAVVAVAVAVVAIVAAAAVMMMMLVVVEHSIQIFDQLEEKNSQLPISAASPV